MPFKHNAFRRHRIGKMKFKVTNRTEYEAGLRLRGSLALTHFCCSAALRCANQMRLQQIEFGSPIHLAFDELQSCYLTFCLSVRPG